MPQEFFDYVRGVSEAIPHGYAANGMKVYRHLVFIGASQLVEAHFPAIRETLGEEGWRSLMQAFIRRSAWASPFYGDLKNEFIAFIERESH